MRRMQTLVTTTALALAASGAFAESHTGSGNQPMPTSDAMDASLCESGYARFDENGDGTLSDSELEASSTSAFGQMDLDGDGAISQSEYIDCVNKMAGTPAAESDRTETNMGRYDANSDGRLTAQEFMNASNSSYDSMQEGNAGTEADVMRLVFIPVGSPPGMGATMGREDVAARSALLFIALDRDESGDIDSSEWTENSPAMKDRSSVLSEAFQRADTDRSGDVDADEYRTAQELIAANAEASAGVADDDSAADGDSGTDSGSDGGGSATDGAETGNAGDTSGMSGGATGSDSGGTATDGASDASGEEDSASQTIEGYEMPMNTLRPDEPAVYFTYDSVM